MYMLIRENVENIQLEKEEKEFNPFATTQRQLLLT